MADTKISALTAGTPAGTSIFPYSDGVGTTLSSSLTAMGGVLGTIIGGSVGWTYVIGNAGTTAISQTGMYPYFEIPFACTIDSIAIMSGTTPGNGTIKVYKGNYGTPPTGTAQTILGAVGTEVIFFTGGTKALGTPTVTALARGDVLAIDLIGVGTIPFLSTMFKAHK